MKTFRRVLFFIAGICLLMACSKSDPFTDNDFNMSNLNKAGISIEEGDVYTLTGKALYQTWKVKDGTILYRIIDWIARQPLNFLKTGISNTHLLNSGLMEMLWSFMGKYPLPAL